MEKVVQKCRSLLPRRRKSPKRLNDGYSDGEFPNSPKAFYKEQYCEALDLIISSINESLDIRSRSIYKQLEDLLLKTVQKKDFEECLTTVTSLILILLSCDCI